MECTYTDIDVLKIIHMAVLTLSKSKCEKKNKKKKHEGKFMSMFITVNTAPYVPLTFSPLPQYFILLLIYVLLYIVFTVFILCIVLYCFYICI